MTVLDGATELYSKTFTLPSEYQNTTVYPCIGGYGEGSSWNNYFKNVKVKPL